MVVFVFRGTYINNLHPDEKTEGLVDTWFVTAENLKPQELRSNRVGQHSVVVSSAYSKGVVQPRTCCPGVFA